MGQIEIPSRTAPAALRKAGRAAFAWVVVFAAFHVYWAFGGHFGFGDAETTVPEVRNATMWVFTVVVGIMFVVGAVVPLALHQDWGRRVPAWVLAWCCWIGGVLLVLRGASGLIDTSLRTTGLVRNGLTGLTYEQELGVAHPSAYTMWSGSAIDAYFALGGVIFLMAAIAYRRARRCAAPHQACATAGR
nr:hypothetical protein GCM10020063_038950 [Dactylosporangium thailandense]